mmetsp:Transcript_7705/g.28213  ORF Transcript_7705/g.28213 Transcript_7705/m.28213 type:complete len:247 (-) Transcript_7705:204-944(-)
MGAARVPLPPPRCTASTSPPLPTCRPTYTTRYGILTGAPHSNHRNSRGANASCPPDDPGSTSTRSAGSQPTRPSGAVWGRLPPSRKHASQKCRATKAPTQLGCPARGCAGRGAPAPPHRPPPGPCPGRPVRSGRWTRGARRKARRSRRSPGAPGSGTPSCTPRGWCRACPRTTSSSAATPTCRCNPGPSHTQRACAAGAEMTSLGTSAQTPAPRAPSPRRRRTACTPAPPNAASNPRTRAEAPPRC